MNGPAGRCALMMMAALLIAAPAFAQLTMAPLSGQATAHLGGAIGTGDAGSALSVGGSVAILEQSGWGAELDFGYADSGSDSRDSLDAQSYMANLIGSWPRGRLRPFGVVGAGAIRARTCVNGCDSAEAWTDWGVNGGGGVQFLFSDVLGVRADARYFTALGDRPDAVGQRLGYWRIAAGVTYLWSIAP